MCVCMLAGVRVCMYVCMLTVELHFVRKTVSFFVSREQYQISILKI